MDFVVGAKLERTEVKEQLGVVPIELLQPAARNLASQVASGETVDRRSGQAAQVQTVYGRGRVVADPHRPEGPDELFWELHQRLDWFTPLHQEVVEQADSLPLRLGRAVRHTRVGHPVWYQVDKLHARVDASLERPQLGHLEASS